MGLSGVALMRIQKELKMLYEEPPPGISAWMRDDENSAELEAGAHEHARIVPAPSGPGGA